MALPTGYGEKYRAEFRAMSIPGSTTDPGGTFRIRLYRRGYTGTVNELQAGRPAFKLSNTVDDLFGINPRRATVTLISSNDIPLTEFYASNERDMLVVIELKPTHDAPSGGYKFPYPYEATKNVYSSIFSGWLTPYQAKQPYQGGKFAITLSATCGLGSLKNFDYDYIPTLTSIHDIIYNCVLKCGYEIPLWVASQIYEESHLQNGQLPNLEFNPLANTRLNTQGFIQNGKRLSCFDVLNRIVSSNYILLQDRGAWKLQRREHLIDFPGQLSYVTYQGADDINPVVVTENVQRNVYKGNSIKPLRGSSEGVEAATESIALTAPYGELVNQLRNGYFTGGLNGWVINSSGFGPVAGLIATPTAVGDGTDENPFALKVVGNAYNSAINKLSYLLGFWSFKQTVNVARTVRPLTSGRGLQPSTNQEQHIINLSIDFVNYYCAGPLLALQVDTDQGKYFLAKEGKFVRRIEDATLTFDNTYRAQNGQLQAKPTKGETFNITSTEPVPGLGNYSVTVFFYQGIALGTSPPNAAIEYRKAQLTIDDNSTIVAVKEVVTVSPTNLDTKLRQRKEEVSIDLVDQTTWHGGAGLRYNAMLRINAIPTLRWVTYQNGVLIRDKWQNLVTKGRIRLQGRLGRTYEGDTAGEFGPLDLMRFVELNNALFVPVRWEWDAADRQITVQARELLNVTSSLKLKGQWESQDGVIFPMPEESTDFSTPTPGGVYIPRQNTASNTNSMGILSALQRSLQIMKVQGVIVQSNPSPSSSISGYITNNTGAIVQTEPPLWLALLSQSQ